jgi:site-specific recombinase XerC
VAKDCVFPPAIPVETDERKIGEIADIEPLHVAAYVEALGKDFEKPTVKQHPAATRMLVDWLVTGQVIATNPAHSVRGPKHVVKTGKTTVLDADQARKPLVSDVSPITWRDMHCVTTSGEYRITGQAATPDLSTHPPTPSALLMQPAG